MIHVAVWTTVTYVGLGAGFAAWFVTRGAQRLDPAAADGSWGFRLLIAPGAAALWPLLAWKLTRGGAA